MSVNNLPQLTVNGIQILTGESTLPVANQESLKPYVFQLLHIEPSPVGKNRYMVTLSDGSKIATCHLLPHLSEWNNLVTKGAYVLVHDFSNKPKRTVEEQAMVFIRKADIIKDSNNSPIINAEMVTSQLSVNRKRNFSNVIGSSEETGNSANELSDNLEALRQKKQKLGGNNIKNLSNGTNGNNDFNLMRMKAPIVVDRTKIVTQEKVAVPIFISQLNQYKSNWVLVVRLMAKSDLIPAANGGAPRLILNFMDAEKTCINLTLFGDMAKDYINKLNVGTIYNVKGAMLNVKSNNVIKNDSQCLGKKPMPSENQLNGGKFTEIIENKNSETVGTFPMHPCVFTGFSSLNHVLSVATDNATQDDATLMLFKNNVKNIPFVDVIGLVKQVGALTTLNNSGASKRDIVLYDKSEFAVTVVLWEELAKQYSEAYFLQLLKAQYEQQKKTESKMDSFVETCDGQTINLETLHSQQIHKDGLDLSKFSITMAIYNVKLSKYNGISLSTDSYKSIVWINSSFSESLDLQQWFLEEGECIVNSNRLVNKTQTTLKSQNSTYELLSISQIKTMKLGSSLETFDTFSILGNPVHVECDPDNGKFPWYEACPECSRGVKICSNGTANESVSYTCLNEKCGFYSILIHKPEIKYRANVTMSDQTGKEKILFFDKQLQTIFDNVPASVVFARYQMVAASNMEEGSNMLISLFNQLRLSRFLVKVRAKSEQPKSNATNDSMMISEDGSEHGTEQQEGEVQNQQSLRAYRKLTAVSVELCKPQAIDTLANVELPKIEKQVEQVYIVSE